jgi:hypothetical protein
MYAILLILYIFRNFFMGEILFSKVSTHERI